MSLLDPTPPAADQGPTGKRYWRSLEDWADTPAFQELVRREFPHHASEMQSPFSRRAFLSLMAASTVFAGALSACRRPEAHILPQSKVPEYTLPGNPEYYATALERGLSVFGLWAKSYDGRPIKLEGNPKHPANLGSLDASAQAAILDLYDPDRLKEVRRAGKRATLEDFLAALGPRLAVWRQNQGAGLAICSELTTSPTALALRDRLLRTLPRARWTVWEPVHHDQVLAGTALVKGQPLLPLHHFANADVVLALDADFLSDGPLSLADSRAFMRRRRLESPQDWMNRLYSVEGVFSLTGAKADHRLRVPSSQIEAFALALTAELATAQPALAGALPPQLAAPRPHAFDRKFIQALARDLLAHPGRSLIVVGPRQPARLHALAAMLNGALGAECVDYLAPPDPLYAGVQEQLRALVGAMRAGQVETLVILGGNPVYTAPGALDFAGALGKVKETIHLTLEPNETTARSTWAVPRLHPLEAWGDARSVDGTVSMVQPLIEPLYGGLSLLEFVALLAGEAPPAGATRPRGFDLVRASLKTMAAGGGDFESTWASALRDGVVPLPPVPLVSAAAGNNAGAAATAFAQTPAAGALAEGEFELVLLPDPYLYDGRFANNGWLQEAPDPLSRIAWDNTVMMNLRTAEMLGVQPGDVLELSAGGQKVNLPAFILPGLADGTLLTYLGYGRTVGGRIVRGKIGQNVYPLRSASGPDFIRGVKLSKTAQRYPLATVEDHWSLEKDFREQIQAVEERELVREINLSEFLKDPDYVRRQNALPPPPELWPDDNYPDRPQWGMAIDLSACIGCNACVLACQAENNIPIVGKEQVANGREMHWLRVDRYYKEDPHDPQMVFQPVPCMQCETAPCEQVCPVAATTHSPQGLNEMTYNRCIGTRYCSNNCPYKVRRFNFFAYNNDLTPSEQLQKNPDVTVRMRGVMEKCTYCVQRTNRTRIEAKNEGRPIRDGEVTTACAQTCPTEAIVFGDIRDPDSLVTALKKQALNYAMLGELNTQPRTTYLAQVRNPNPELKS